MSSRASFCRRRFARAIVSMCIALLASALAGASALASPTFLGSFNPVERPTGMAVEEATGNVFVPVSGEDFDEVRVFGKNGGAPAGGAPTAFSPEGGSFSSEPIWSGWGSPWTTRPSSAAGTIYVIDRGHQMVNRFRLVAGEFQSGIPLTGAPDGFAEPEGVATDADGDVYVSDRGSGTGGAVREFSPGGSEIASFPAKGLERSASVTLGATSSCMGTPPMRATPVVSGPARVRPRSGAVRLRRRALNRWSKSPKSKGRSPTRSTARPTGATWRSTDG